MRTYFNIYNIYHLLRFVFFFAVCVQISASLRLTLIGGEGRTASPTPIASAEPSERPEPLPSQSPFPSHIPQPSRIMVASAYRDTHKRFRYDMHHTRSGYSLTSMIVIFVGGIAAGAFFITRQQRRRQERDNTVDMQPIAATSYTSLMPVSYDEET